MSKTKTGTNGGNGGTGRKRARRKKVRVLVAAHEEGRAEELGGVMDDWGADTEVSAVGHKGLQSLLDHDADLVVIDTDGHCADTAEFIAEIRKMSPWTGLVVLGREDDPDLEAALEQVGALQATAIVSDAKQLTATVSAEMTRRRRQLEKQAEISIDRLRREQDFLQEITRCGMTATTFGDAMREVSSGLGEILPIAALAALDLSDTPVLKFYPVQHVTWEFLSGMERDLRERYGALTDGEDLPDPIEWHVSRALVRKSGKSVVRTCYTLPVMVGGRIRSLLSFAAAKQDAFSDIEIAFLYRAAHQLATVLAGFHRIRKQAIRDGLTGLYNRSYLDEQLGIWRRQSIRENLPVGIILMDLDELKAINDAYGHLVGDDVLREFGEIAERTARDSDAVSRYGGDEIAILLHDATIEDTQSLAGRLLAAVRDHVFCEGRLDLHVSTSCGATSISPGQARVLSTRDMIGRADKALYRAKMEGRDRVATWPVVEVEAEQEGAARTAEQRIAAAVRSAVLTTLRSILKAQGYIEGPHWSRTREMALVVGRELGLSGDALSELGDGVFLHDVGKLALPVGLLEKDGPLNDEERHVLQQHPEKGAVMLKAFPFFRGAAEIVQQHQEWFNGEGYPNGLAGEDICIGARIAAVADAYDAIRSDRPYRVHRPPEEAVAELERNRGIQFDPVVVDVFIENLDEIERIGRWGAERNAQGQGQRGGSE